jgi:predicted nucleotide-binding protein
MTQLQTTATRLEFYLVWLALRSLTRSEGAVVEPLRHAITAFLDRIDALLDLDIDRERRREIAEVVGSIRGSRLVNGALRGACSRLADLLGIVVSEPGVPLRRPKIDQITYIRLLQLAVHIRENEPDAEDLLSAEQLAARANVSLDRVHAAVARMLADGVVHLPIADEDGRADAFEMNEPAAADEILFAPEVDREWHPHRDEDREGAPASAAPNPHELVVIHGRGTARTAFFFELLRRLGLRPLALDELAVRSGAGSPSTREVVRSAFARAQAVIVLFTADDLAGLRPDQPGLPGLPQPHLHVLFEAGMAVALQHTRTIIVEVPPLSGLLDLADVHTVRFANGAPEERYQLVRKLRAAGCEPDTEGSTWLNLEYPGSGFQPP